MMLKRISHKIKQNNWLARLLFEQQRCGARSCYPCIKEVVSIV